MLTGACLSRAGLNRKTALATLTLTLATESPDIDSVTYFGGGVTGLQHHRGITHSFLGAPFVAAIVVAGVYGIYRLVEARRKARPAYRMLLQHDREWLTSYNASTVQAGGPEPGRDKETFSCRNG